MSAISANNLITFNVILKLLILGNTAKISLLKIAPRELRMAYANWKW